MRGDKASFQKAFESFLTNPEYQKYSRVIEYNGAVIGTINLTNIEDGTAHLHGHFWNKNYRGKGLGILAGALAVKWLIRENKLNGIYIFPPKDNPMSSKIPQKLGLTPIEKDVELKYTMLRSGVFGDKYYLSKEEIEELSKRILNQEELK